MLILPGTTKKAATPERGGNFTAPITKRLPRHDLIPAALIGRLARDERVRGEGIGGLLLADAVRRMIGVTRSLAVFAIVVGATDEKGAVFYRDFRFTPFSTTPKFFMSASEVAEAVSRVLSR
jgi:hypothetical protein